jgi:phosphoglucosamine mutase
MPGRLFGTDGVRGLAGVQLTAELALRLGWAAASLSRAQRPQVLIVRDTRESGGMLEAALAAGVSSAGGDVLLGGVLPTPAAPLLLRRYELDIAAVISASHNPYRDNGIKLFGGDGFKLSDGQEREIEAALDRWRPGDAAVEAAAAREMRGSAAPPAIGCIRELRGAEEDYLRELHARFASLSLAGTKVALDCANGATCGVAPEIFRRLGAEVSVLADTPDGRNINDGCGSTHIDRLVELMKAGGRDVGFAFDGDGDRVLAVDRDGEVVDGDELLALIALHLHDEGRLTGGGVAVTVMSNFGFHAAMERAGIAVVSTSVGDRYVLEELRGRGWTLGGEQSGHIIEMGFNRSGDGIASALLTLEALNGVDLSSRDAMQKLPQRLTNVPVADAGRLSRCEAVRQETREAERRLRGRGRVLVRASGTEPLVRVMVEAPSEQEAEEVCDRIAALVQRELGGGSPVPAGGGGPEPAGGSSPGPADESSPELAGGAEA